MVPSVIWRSRRCFALREMKRGRFRGPLVCLIFPPQNVCTCCSTGCFASWWCIIPYGGSLERLYWGSIRVSSVNERGGSSGYESWRVTLRPYVCRTHYPDYKTSVTIATADCMWYNIRAMEMQRNEYEWKRETWQERSTREFVMVPLGCFTTRTRVYYPRERFSNVGYSSLQSIV